MSEDQEGQESKRPATERADELLNRAGWTAGLFASMIGVRLGRVAAFAREEAEDMWAEARAMRERSTVAQPGADVEADEAAARENTEPAGGVRTGDYVGAAGREEEEPEAPSEQDARAKEEEESIRATDTARRRAEELGVNLQEVKGTGSGGQITVADVKKKAGAES